MTDASAAGSHGGRGGAGVTLITDRQVGHSPPERPFPRVSADGSVSGGVADRP